MNPIVSVVMPVYNVEAYVAEAIDSVLAQTLPDFELIIVDDGGHDRSLEICRSYHDARIRIVSQSNRGLAGARNTGIAAARASYVAFLDSDDRWLPEKLALHVIHLDNNPSDGVSFSPSRFIDCDGSPMRLKQTPKLQGIKPADGAGTPWQRAGSRKLPLARRLASFLRIVNRPRVTWPKIP